MTTAEENVLLTQSGPGTAGGRLMRCYWQPVALSSDLPADAPLPVRILGEDLVLFRDNANGRPGLLGVLCPHRCADLSYGRVEDGGLRCIYHGWLFDRSGQCLDQPGEPEESRMKEQVRHKAYPCEEASGVIFAYMGLGKPPLFPKFHFLTAPDPHVYAMRVFHQCNWLQAMEGNIDPIHLSYLHAIYDAKKEKGQTDEHVKFRDIIFSRPRAQIDVVNTRYGIRIYARRQAEAGKDFVRSTNFILPNLGIISGEAGRQGTGGYTVHWHVPIDDESHWRFDFYYHPSMPIDKEAIREVKRNEMSKDGVPFRNADNRYMQDREEMKSKTFAGLGSYFTSHDLLAVQSPGAIHDRSRETLGTTDVAIARARRLLLDGIKVVEKGEDPPMVIRSENENIFNDIIVMGTLLDSDANHRTLYDDITGREDFHAYADLN